MFDRNNPDEWRLLLCRHLDNRANSYPPDGLSFVALEITKAIHEATEQLRARVAQLERSDCISQQLIMEKCRIIARIRDTIDGKE